MYRIHYLIVKLTFILWLIDFFLIGVGGLCKSWKETETQLEGDVYWGVRWDSHRSEETNGGDGEACRPVQGSIPSEELCEVVEIQFTNLSHLKAQGYREVIWMSGALY